MEMQTIKVNRINKNIKLGDVSYRPYTIGELPNSFGFLSSEDGEQEGVSKWFNYKGLTYLKDDRSKSQR
jgi:hypothetical protein